MAPSKGVPAAVATACGLYQRRRGGGPRGFPVTLCDHGIPFLLPGKGLSSLRTGLPADLSSVWFQWETPHPPLSPGDLPLPSYGPRGVTPQLQKQSPLGALTMQGVGQHAGHTLHHHLVGGLEESRGWGLGLPSLGELAPRENHKLLQGKNWDSHSPQWGQSTLDHPTCQPSPNPSPQECC